jgi:hypothetical protein
MAVLLCVCNTPVRLVGGEVIFCLTPGFGTGVDVLLKSISSIGVEPNTKDERFRWKTCFSFYYNYLQLHTPFLSQ